MRKDLPSLNEMLFFNVSVIGDNEEVTLAQLHLHRRRLTKTHVNYHKKFLPSPYRVILYQIQPDYRRKIFNEDAKTMKLASLPVSHLTKGGWHTLDVTPIIRELLINAQGPVELLLGVQFEAPKRLDKTTYSPLVPLKHFLKNPTVNTPEHPFKTFSYLVVFSEADPFFDDFDDEDDVHLTSNIIPTSPPNDFKERHLKHKLSNDNNRDNNNNNNNSNGKKISSSHKEGKKIKNQWKYKKIENEVYKIEKNDVIRHKNKHKGNEVRRSKADELALKEKTKLKSLPFLHANEVEKIRQTSRRLTRSSMVHRREPKTTSELISPVKNPSLLRLGEKIL
ncbi:hypothetical protein Phum_PHUM330030 [Pediculus humanus corporis]|uniref:TGF-beta propeptide domain-containing protein n=1 Tax=Pediculus humanus subsp. corporis TaxID=121224 RepID=E0VN70_PEDHC|nr:uncharacterized protein Phum_PHUM330030 [Pediculus humanus corporis]EEB14826.1 hypothetical protein Phum_PHUM330030 [Pediculus humanus corporis]